MSFKFVFKIPASDFSVARFLQQSKINSSKLEIIIRDFATIKFWNAYNDKSDKSSNPNEKKNRKKIEFHFKPKPVRIFLLICFYTCSRFSVNRNLI